MSLILPQRFFRFLFSIIVISSLGCKTMKQGDSHVQSDEEVAPDPQKPLANSDLERLTTDSVRPFLAGPTGLRILVGAKKGKFANPLFPFELQRFTLGRPSDYVEEMPAAIKLNGDAVSASVIPGQYIARVKMNDGIKVSVLIPVFENRVTQVILYWSDLGLQEIVYSPTSAQLQSGDIDVYRTFAALQVADPISGNRRTLFGDLANRGFNDPYFLAMQVFGIGGNVNNVNIPLTQSLASVVDKFPDSHIVAAWIAESRGQKELAKKEYLLALQSGIPSTCLALGHINWRAYHLAKDDSKMQWFSRLKNCEGVPIWTDDRNSEVYPTGVAPGL